MKCNSITPFLWLNGTAVQAAELYRELFEDAEIIETMPGPGDQPMGVTMRIGELKLTLFNGGPAHELSEAFSLMISVDTQDEVDHFWRGLTDGGSEGPCGWCKDRYGVSWQVVPTALMQLLGGEDREGAARAGQAMQGMKKLVIAELQSAYDGG